MPSNRMPGKFMGVKINGQFISCETNCVFNFDTDLIGASPVDAGRWKEWIAGVRSWNVAVDAGLLMRMAGTGLNTVLNAFLTGERIFISFTTRRDDIPDLIIEGYAYVQNGSIAAAVVGKGSWNTTLMGDGPFTVGINTNVVYAISTNLEDTEILQDGNNNIIVGEYGN